MQDDQQYVRVQHAIQGHPESPRLWQIFIDAVLRDMNFIPTTHEPCIYRKILSDGTEAFILRQVDDIAVAATTEDVADKIIAEIGTYMKAPIKKGRPSHNF